MSNFIRRKNAVLNVDHQAYMAAKAARKKQNEIDDMKKRINTLEATVNTLVERLNECNSKSN